MSTGWNLEFHETLPSTSDYLRAWLKDGGRGMLAVLAGIQTAGRGRRGRCWQSAAGNLAFSVLVPAAPIPEGYWALLAGLATIEALPAGLQLKWPNDITLHGAKLAGMLVETEVDPRGTPHRIIGIGVNVVIAPRLPDRPTACLAELGPPPTPLALAQSILARLARWHGIVTAPERAGDGGLAQAWLARAHPIGTHLTLTTPQGQTEGRFAGLAPDGALLLDSASGLATHHSAEIVRARTHPEIRPSNPNMPAMILGAPPN